MPAKPFRIVETLPDPPSAETLARTHHLSQRDETVITNFVIAVRSSKATGKSANAARVSPGRRAAARKK